MSLIVEIIDGMDQLLATSRKSGGAPGYFILREKEWIEIGERFKGDGIETGVVADGAFRGVPVRTGELTAQTLASLVDRNGTAIRHHVN